MAESDEWTEWHLTAAGWVRGSRREDFTGTLAVPDPPGSIAVYMYSRFQSSMYSKQERTTRRVRPNVASDEETALLEVHGACPASF